MQDESHASRGRLATSGADQSILGDFSDAAAALPAGGQRTARRERSSPARLFRYRVVKRSLDLFLVTLALPVLLPVISILWVIVRLTSPGPVFFGSRRVGHQATFFSMWKFRTMSVDSAAVLARHLSQNPEARAEWARSAKLRDDPRITPSGRFLRRYSLDELPQFWHVLTGEMSLVGPRPLPPLEVERYGDKFDDFCCVKPGLTGLWQVSGRSNLSYDERVALDCNYIQNWSLSRDLLILCKTVKPVLDRDGAY